MREGKPTKPERKREMYGYYELTGMISDEKFNTFEEVEQWAVNNFGCYNTDYLFAVNEEELN